MDFKAATISQYRVSLAMLEQAIKECPDSMWNAPEPSNRFWQVAYHALFYAHLYLQEAVEHFQPWTKHRDKYEALGHAPGTGDIPLVEPLTKDDVLEYLCFCRNEVSEKVTALDLESQSGFHWLPFDKTELHLYNIRHLMLHTGELCERLGSQAQIDVKWVGLDHG